MFEKCYLGMAHRMICSLQGLNYDLIPALFKCEDVDSDLIVFLENFLCVFLCIERVHQDQRDIRIILLIHMLKSKMAKRT